MKRIIIAGGTGFLGQVLARAFSRDGMDVCILTRRLLRKLIGRQVLWDGKALGSWTAELEGADAVINLCGRSVNCRYHARNREAILLSRTIPTRVLGEAIARCERPPAVWLNSSTATIYRHSFSKTMDENGEIGGTPEAKDEFSVMVAVEWERVFNAMATPRTRKVLLRNAMVLGHARNSVFPALRMLARTGLGGRMAGGGQFVSCIHEIDFYRVIRWIIEREDFSGVVNVAAPNPLPNREAMRILREECGLSAGMPMPLWLLELGAFVLRTETELVIKSRRVVPGRLTASVLSSGSQTFAMPFGRCRGRLKR
ncbi:MAG TPA: NAD-dependent epimerase/dehydratase family protein [Verrucomicrobiota bacterium]|nr:NAD-dependent epimerase/dehydratase family protein [Verrucomicrobiota bacterium]